MTAALLALSWESPAFAAALPVVVLVVLGTGGLRHLRARRAARALGRPAPSWKHSALAMALPGLGGLGLVLAMMGPLHGEARAATTWRGADIVICLDVSRSMLAQDATPTRLEAAQADLARLAGLAENDRLALIAFAGTARVVVPLTDDHASFVALAQGTTPADVERGGTNLGAALDLAYDLLEGREVLRGQAPPAPGAILLLTDGEDLEARGLDTVRTRHGTGVVSAVHGLGYGSERGSKITLRMQGPGGTRDVYLTDRAGKDVLSAVDVPSLTRLTAATGGAFERAREGAGLPRLYEDALVPLAQEAVLPGLPEERPNRFRLPLLVGLAVWIVAWSRAQGRDA